jgi:hypothetical protein
VLITRRRRALLAALAISGGAFLAPGVGSVGATATPPATDTSAGGGTTVPDGSGAGAPGTDDPSWLVIGLIAGGVVVLAGGLARVLHTTTPPPAADSRSGVRVATLVERATEIATRTVGRGEPGDAAVAARRERARVLATAQWFHDQLVPELLTGPPDRAARRWELERGRIDDLIVRTLRHSAGPDDPWRALAGAVAALDRSVDTSVALRARRPPNVAVITDADSVTARRRAELGAVLDALWPGVRAGR